MKKYHVSGIIVVLAVIIAVAGAGLFFQADEQNIPGNEPNFSVRINDCTFNGAEQGILSFNFDVNVTSGHTGVPGQIVFQIINYTKDYSFHKYPLFHRVMLTREKKLDRVYHENETIKVSVLIDNVYGDYRYLPSEYFNYQLFYCNFNDRELNELKGSGRIFDVLDDGCSLFFDYEHYYKDHMYSMNQHPGQQCTVILRDSEGGIREYYVDDPNARRA